MRMAASGTPARPLREAPSTHEESTILERELALPSFTSADAFELGLHIRSRIRALHPSTAALVLIHLHDVPVFLTTTAPGVARDNHEWAARKMRTVARWGCSSWAMGRKMAKWGPSGVDTAQMEKDFAQKFALGPDTAGQFALHGGAVPIRVRNVEGHVGVAVVSGLRQQDDHMVVVEALEWLQQSMAAVPLRSGS